MEGQMDDRLRQAEGDLRDLHTWRRTAVDPWLQISRQFHEETTEFMVTFRATEIERAKVSAEQHKSNSFKLNLIVTLAAVTSVIVAVAELVKALK